MLDTETKRRIDSARDILVGKVPDPKAQVEQITTALIYKFMDDMDKESMELGGKAKFFSDGFEQYSWTRIISNSLSGFDRLNLYSESIQKMSMNKNLPQLFRDMFKGAFLPYRDPETLNLFLKEIDGFSYDHSERLGDAFEYLLSVLGSQGDAGQFRTPRHIIDFMVRVVNPQKNDTILDPACGTAGFLISAYKHITKSNKAKPLTPDEKARLTRNFTGYDISPDMVKLSLVNMYLHNFPNPKIQEYDTLTSEEKWDDTFDVVLANPPFMSPKGGIRPHQRFSVKAKRSEVLFVDYIAEHLNIGGRAGIIVPEGIIFQSQNAYKELRKMLVEEHLYAVVSLPAGAFNPYSGVKTSILLMDKAIAKKSDNILFIKIDNDGFGLGAQRRAFDKNDLPVAEQIINEYITTCNTSVSKSEHLSDTLKKKYPDSKIWSIATKEKIAKSGDYNLSGERYKASVVSNTKHDIVELSSIINLSSGRGLTSKDVIQGEYPVYGGNGINNYHNQYFIEESTIAIGRVGAYCGSVHLTNPKSWITDNALYVTKLASNVDQKYLSKMIEKLNLNQFAKVGGQPSISQRTVLDRAIPLPPLEIQKEIVAEIEGYQKIIDGARQVVENYKPQIQIDPSWKMVELGKVCEVNSGTVNPSDLYDDWFTYIDISSVQNGSGEINYDNKINVADAPSRARREVKWNDILLSTVRPNLKAFGYIDKEPNRFIASTGFAVLRTREQLESKFLYYLVFQELMQTQMINKMGKGAYPSINQSDVKELKIPLPTLTKQKDISAQIEKEQEIVNANKELIKIFEQKIKDRIAKVWGE